MQMLDRQKLGENQMKVFEETRNRVGLEIELSSWKAANQKHLI